MDKTTAKQEPAMKTNEELGTAPILPILLRFAIPSIIAMLVNSLYNIVDQIFIGQYVGYLGNAATSICFPFVTISMSLGLMNADGSSAFFSLLQGKKQQDKATKVVGAGLVLSVILGCLLLLIFQVGLPQFLNLFGSTEAVYPYAYSYARITICGMPFVCISMFIAGIIRVDGNPTYAMICMVSGCIANIILDALFVIGFDMGVEGAALATIMGQLVNFIISLAYLGRFRTFRLSRNLIRFKPVLSVQSCTLGVSSLITQLSNTVVIILGNVLLVKYGIESKFGADIPLAAFGIVMKCNQIIMSILLGLGVGAQPILGFNYGAGQFNRVKKTFLIVIFTSTVAAIIGWGIFQFGTMSIVSIFGQESDLYNEYAVMCFRIFLKFIFLGGFTINTGIFFQAIGKAKIAMTLSMSRQILYYIPAVLILTSIFGLMGCLYVGPVSEVLSACTCAVFVVREMKLLKQNEVL